MFVWENTAENSPLRACLVKKLIEKNLDFDGFLIKRMPRLFIWELSGQAQAARGIVVNRADWHIAR